MPFALRECISGRRKSLSIESRADRPPRIRLPASTAPPRSQALILAYGLFDRLPLELRQQILKHAFSLGRIHIDLAYGHPKKHFEPVYENSIAIKRNLATGYRHANIVGPDYTKPKQWQWSSCVCHMTENYTPCLDACQTGEGACLNIHRFGRDRRRCFIGIDGWMKACWMSYIEGTETLFAENIVELSSPIFVQPMSKLPTLFNQELLNKIRSLSLLTSKSYTSDFFASIAQYKDCLITIPYIFPFLLNLYVVLSASIASDDLDNHGRLLTMQSFVIMSCDELVRKLPETNIDISIDWRLGRLLLMKYSKTGKSIDNPNNWRMTKFWKPLDKDDSLEGPGKGYFLSALH